MAHQTPVTVERIERVMDEVALAIDMAGDRGVTYLPIYERLERELQECRAKHTAMDAVKERVLRLKQHEALSL